jgi:hypothetical protein
MRGFATSDYQADLKAVRSPVAVLVGEKDELFEAGQFPATIGAVRSDVPVTILPGLTHIGLITDPGAVPAIAAAIRGGK